MPKELQNKKVRNASVLVAARPDRMRDSLLILLKSVLGINIVGQAGDSSAALRMFSEHHPALVLLDTNLPGEGFVTMLQHIKSDGFQSRCLVLADDAQRQQQAQAAGADAALLKGFTTAELFETTKRLLTS
jgi:DNA-binding NarL/FixJ family response regulator